MREGLLGTCHSLAAALPFLLAAPALHAALLTVTTTADDLLPGDGRCSLREAVLNANQDTDTTRGDCQAGSGADTIVVPSGAYPASGGLEVTDDLTLSGSGADSTSIDALEVGNAITVTGDVEVALQRMTITGAGSAGVYNTGSLTLSACVVSGNQGRGIESLNRLYMAESTVAQNSTQSIPGFTTAGGGILVTGGTATLERSEVAGNRASFQAGFPGYGGSGPGYGGGIATSGSLTLLQTSVSDNTADLNPYDGSGGHGGGLAVFANGEALLVNSLVSGNVANAHYYGDGHGGGIYAAGRLKLINSTVSGNQARGYQNAYSNALASGGGIFASISSDVDLVNSTIYGNVAYRGAGLMAGSIVTAAHSVFWNPGGVNPGANCEARLSSGGYNMLGPEGCPMWGQPPDPTSTVVADPVLGPLQDNGGPTLTHALLPGSPALNAIPLEECTYDDDSDPDTPEVPLTTDQRGVRRPQNGRCDIGAYERGCGLGAEMAILLPLLGAVRRRSVRARAHVDHRPRRLLVAGRRSRFRQRWSPARSD